MDKQYVVSVIERIENNAKTLPQDLRSGLENIKSNLAEITQDRFELLTNGAVRVSPEQISALESNPLDELRALYSDLEALGFSGEPNSELQQAIIQLRGIFGIPDRYFP